MGYPQERREMRFPVDGMQGSLRSPKDVRILNLSRNGIAFETSHRLTVGEDYFLEVRYKGQTAYVGVNLRWCSTKRGPAMNGPVFLAGGVLVDVDHDGGLWSGLVARQPRAADLEATIR